MPPPRDRSSAKRRIGDRAWKFGAAALVFCTVLTGYTLIEDRRLAAVESQRPLPDAQERSGACTLWFVGSSTVFRWRTLPRDFAGWNVHNRGVNGAMIPQIIDWFGNEPPGNPPAAIVFYSGENDIAGGATAAAAFADFRRFMEAKTARYGALPVVAVSLKPSPTRWPNLPDQTAFNDALRRYAAARDDLGFVDIRPLMLTNGRPGPYYVEDGIHMNQRGYDRWASTLRTALSRMLPREVVKRCTPRAA